MKWNFMRRPMAVIALFILAAPLASKASTELTVASGGAGSDAYMAGLGLMSLAKIKLSPSDGIAIRSVLSKSPDDNLRMLASKEAELAILPAASVQNVNPEDLRTIMCLWEQAPGSEAKGPMLLVARADLDQDVVYKITEAIFGNRHILSVAKSNLADLSMEQALNSLTLPLHAGARLYYEEKGVRIPADTIRTASVEAEPVVATPPPAVRKDDPAGREPAVAALDQAPASPPVRSLQGEEGKTFVVYFDFDKDQPKKSDIAQLAASCQFAATLPKAHFKISGHTDLAGPETYNDELAERRAVAVESMIRSDPRFRENLDVIKMGEQAPAVPTPDGVPEPLNRRVEVTVINAE